MNFKKLFIWFTIGLMVLSAAVQWNDPDPVVWMLVYLLVAFLGYRKLSGKDAPITTGAVAFVYILWAWNLFPDVWEGLMFNETQMRTINIELARESLGLLIGAGLLLIYTFVKNK
jgi:hypothetical protein